MVYLHQTSRVWRDTWGVFIWSGSDRRAAAPMLDVQPGKVNGGLALGPYYGRQFAYITPFRRRHNAFTPTRYTVHAVMGQVHFLPPTDAATFR